MSTDLDDGALIGIESAEEELEIAKVHDYFVTVTGGLEDVALREIKSTLKGVSQIHVNKRQRQGRIHFRYERSPKRLLELKTVEGVFALLRIFRGVTTGRPGLIRIAEEISTLDLAPGVVLHNILHGVPETAGVAINCTVGKGHRFSSSELHQVLKTVLAATYNLSEEEQRGPYYLQVRIEGNRAVVGFRLSERSLTAGTPGGGAGDILAPAARAIGSLVQPEKGERWLDPTCRGGVVLATFAETFGIRPVGLDTRKDWLTTTQAALENCDGSAVAGWDGVELPSPANVFDGIFAHLGRRRGLFHPRLQTEFERVLTHYGKAIVLCERDKDLEQNAGPFRCVDRRPLYIRGETLSLYHLRKST
jgi:hypothetical protein